MTRHRRGGRLPARLDATRARSRGFTLIEVVVALTITGFLLGGLFTLVGGSKRLSWRAEAALGKSLQQRAAWDFALRDVPSLQTERLAKNSPPFMTSCMKRKRQELQHLLLWHQCEHHITQQPESLRKG